MTIKIRFQLFRQPYRQIGSRSLFRTIAIWSLHGRKFSMSDLRHVVDNYSISCTPNISISERPMTEYFELEFEEYMYNAFILAEN